MRKTILTAAAAAAGVILAQVPLAFEVASVKPDKRYSWVRRPWSPNIDCGSIGHCGVSGNRFEEDFASLDDLIMDAYKVRRYQIVNAPNWADTGQDVYQIEAKAPGDSLTLDQARQMLQTLLADRFRLKIHRERRDLPVYALVIGKSGSKLTASEQPCNLPGIQPQRADSKGGGKAGDQSSDAKIDSSERMGVQAWVHTPEMLEGRLDRPVIDQTGFDAPTYCTATGDAALVTLQFQLGPGGGGRGADPQDRTAIPGDSAAPSIFTAVEDLWGLKLEARKAPADVIVIDHVERPSVN